MTATADLVSSWNKRYACDDYLYGEGPNAFLRANAYRLAAGQSALCVVDDDGRNSVWLAEQGLAVTAFDFAQTAIAKARRWRSDGALPSITVCATSSTGLGSRHGSTLSWPSSSSFWLTGSARRSSRR